MTSYFSDGSHDVHPPRSSIRRLPANPPSACDVIGLLCTLQFLTHSTFVLVSDIYRITPYRFCGITLLTENVGGLIAGVVIGASDS